jgi:hypothetical protein
MMTVALLRHSWLEFQTGTLYYPVIPSLARCLSILLTAFRIGIKPTVRFASAGFGGFNFDRF